MRVKEDYKKYYTIGRRVGEGFGIVYEAIKKDTNEKRAIKIIDKNLIKNPFRNETLKEPTDEEIKPYIDCFYKEIRNMKLCQGENYKNNHFVKFYEYFDTKDEFAIVMELCEENMLSFITKKQKLSIEEIKSIMKQLNKAFEIMTKNNIIYRDLKLENILIKNEKNKKLIKLKLGDGSNLITGLRKNLSSTKNKFYCNLYNAPEILNKQKFNEECDLWSLGVIIYVLCFKHHPYKGVTEDAIIKNIKKEGQKNFGNTGNKNLDDLIRKLLVLDPQKRLTWKEYFNHPFFISDYKEIYELGKILGTGGYGNVYEAKIKTTGELRALKIFDLNIIINHSIAQTLRPLSNEEIKTYFDDFYKEMNHMKIIEGNNKNNKNAVKVYEYYKNNNEFVIVMELCDTNLLDYFAKRNKPFNPEEIKKLLKQLNKSFKIMVNNNLVHRAINLQNILIKYENNDKTKFIAKLKLTEDSIKLKELPNNLKIKNIDLILKTVAPEILKEENYNEKCDLWSLGVIIYILCFQSTPYKGNESQEILEEINNFKMTKDTNNSDLNDLLKKLLKIDPKERINWNDYFSHPFFNEIKKEDYHNYYDQIQRIGEGGYGVVYKAIKKDTKEKRAIKVIDKDRIRNNYRIEYFKEISKEEMEKIINSLYNEIINMKIIEDIDNENTVRCYECFDIENEFAIVMELCDENLTKYFANKKETFNYKEIVEFLNQLNNTFRIMNKNRLVHRDLKLENILIKKENNKIIYKLSDYGFSKQLYTISKKFSTKIGTFYFISPEILREEKYNQECDLWSLGVIIYIRYFRKYPYTSENEIGLLNQIESQGQKALKKTGNFYLDDLIGKLLTGDQYKRITWEDYFNHPIFQGNPIPPKRQENKIIITLEIKKSSLSNDIYFLDQENHINELDDSNTEIYINKKKVDFKKYFKTNKEGEYEIIIIFKNKIKNCNYMFNKCKYIKSIDLSSFDSSNVTNMSYMFSECFNLEKINITNLNVDNVIDMSYMFNKCYELKSLQFPESFKTQNLENMNSMFHWCQNLKEIIFSPSFTTQKVTNMKTLFGKCYNIKKLILIYFNTKEVKDMSYMFDQCNSLEEILINPFIFKTDKVTNMSHMFSECFSLKEIDLSSFNVENVRHTSYMFYDCKKLDIIDLSKSKINDKANMSHMFEGCSNIILINISPFKVIEEKKIENMFDNISPNIENVIINEFCIEEYIKIYKNIKDKFLFQ